MEFNNPSEIVKDLYFGSDAKQKIIKGVEKLARAVKSTLGASGKCVIYEDGLGKPVITKDGVTVADSVVLLDPVENIGATLIKEASKNTVREAGDGTTTAIVLAEALLKEVNNPEYSNESIRDIKNGIESGYKKVVEYLSKHSKAVAGDQLSSVSAISCNNDKELGDIIAKAYEKVGKDGVVLMDESETDETFTEIVDGVQFDSGLMSQHFATNKDKQICELENPYVLLVSSPIPNIRKIQSILEHVIKTRRPLLIIAEVEQQVKSALLMNKVKGNINVNIIDPPGFGGSKDDTIEDLAFLTGAKVINEELGDDLDLIQPDCLGEVVKSVTSSRTTVLTTGVEAEDLKERILDVKKKIKKEKVPYFKRRLQDRLAMLSGSVGIIHVGADSKVELKEKKDRVEDAIYAVKAALQEGIVPGGGVALLNAASLQTADNIGQKILFKALSSPYETILDNAGLQNVVLHEGIGYGIDVTTGKEVDMIKTGIIDPVLVTKTALKNAVSVVSTIISADCVISNIRIPHASS
jgi:chaperonin GroEL|tara:strand:+ start:688 stop:2259 length:1572 start_codon:yes stop_codon:yes gene_type:complete